jgi:glycosyltransferase involved in cell wall biosynthesis
MLKARKIRRELQSMFPHVDVPTKAAQREIAILIPCYNEEITIGNVVKSFAKHVPSAKIYVYDNASTDRTSEEAIAAGAILRRENLRGKGNVVRRMFADIDADVYILADGDETYDASAVGQLIDTLVTQNLDMVVGTRVDTSQDAYRNGHRLGNQIFNKVVQSLFGQGFSDIFSGYRAFSRRFVKSFPAASAGFEIETELSTHALELRLPTKEIPLPYFERPENSKSKLNTYRDGIRILWAIVRIYQAHRPLQFFGGIGLVLFALSMLLGLPVVYEFVQTGTVPRFPTAILAAALMQMSWLSIASGIIIRAIARMRREMHRMHYLDL